MIHINLRTLIAGLNSCPAAIIRDFGININIRAYNSEGTLVEVIGCFNCSRMDMDGFNGQVLARAHTTAVEKKIRKDLIVWEASSVTLAAMLYGCTNGTLLNLFSNSTSEATVSQDATEGITQAVALGLHDCPRNTIIDSVANVHTVSDHPINRSYLRQSYRNISPGRHENLTGNCLQPDSFGKMWI